jgi:acyl-coenzyme A thioesterase PaaI-like protein
MDDVGLQVMEMLGEKLGERVSDFLFPPPVFTTMQGEFVSVDMDAGLLAARFPVLQRDMNPYGYMQGGMIAAAVDNTIGPLSVLVAPPNVTRTLEMKYSLPVTQDIDTITVEAKLLEQDGRWLRFSADVRSPDGQRLARAKAVHVLMEA